MSNRNDAKQRLRKRIRTAQALIKSLRKQLRKVK